MKFKFGIMVAASLSALPAASGAVEGAQQSASPALKAASAGAATSAQPQKKSAAQVRAILERELTTRLGPDPFPRARAMETLMNRVAPGPLPKVEASTRELHSRLQIADLHADSLLWSRDISKRGKDGHVDLPRLKEGNVALQTFASVTKVPKGRTYDNNSSDTDEVELLVLVQGQPEAALTSLLERSLWHASKLATLQKASGNTLLPVRSRKDVTELLARRSKDSNVTGALLAIEGLHNLEGKLGNVDRLFSAGYRMAAPVHFFDNELGGSAHGMKKGGLTSFGRQVVQRMESNKMIVDVAHASPELLNDILAVAKRPLVSSHGGVQSACPGPRNLSDAQIKAIASKGGLIGIGYWEGAVCDISPSGIAAAIKHAVRIAGIDHVALGSDFDGSIKTSFDTAQLVHLTQSLVDHGFTEAEIRKVMGGNYLAFLAKHLP